MIKRYFVEIGGCQLDLTVDYGVYGEKDVDLSTAPSPPPATTLASSSASMVGSPTISSTSLTKGSQHDQYVESFADRWIKSIADKFVAAFGELTKVGSMSNGEGVYRRIDH